MNQTDIINLLTNSGLKDISINGNFIYFQDPSCIYPAFDSLLEYAWIACVVFTAIMLFGWGILYIKNGVKLDTLFNNAKTLILIFATLSVVKPIVNVIYGENLFAKQCEQKRVSLSAVNELLAQRKKTLSKYDENVLHENFVVTDSGPTISVSTDDDED